ncbi:MAG TPA: UvrD-helicase domain-containing protein, partial [Rhodocyclaceae bacterium]|nr:UvrD-helicase domain-containing protein [Rhodocyclaceae bacterium]
MIAPHPPDSPAAVELDVLSCPLDGIRLIEASAGTGKTWAICSLYLRLLLERQLALSRILVVTFTNAAAAELRERIRNRLAEMIHLVRPGATTAD